MQVLTCRILLRHKSRACRTVAAPWRAHELGAPILNQLVLYASALAITGRCKGVRDRRSSQDHPARTVPDRRLDVDRSLTLRLDGFAWEILDEEAARDGLTIEALIAFSVLYYLADADSGRIAREITRSPNRRALDAQSLRDGVGDDRASPSFPVRRIAGKGQRSSEGETLRADPPAT